jgi:DNA polymerase-3 subunit chi
MTRIDFYVNVPALPETARVLAGKAFRAGQHALVYTADSRLAQQLDQWFWTAQQLEFLPHVRCGHPLARQTPVLIGVDPEELGSADVLINVNAETPGFFSRFERVLELVGSGDDDLARGRARYRHYRERGYALQIHDRGGRK